MQCPQCKEVQQVKFLVRHIETNDCQNKNIPNVITIFCEKCGYNESLYLNDCIDKIFPFWKNDKIQQIEYVNDEEDEDISEEAFAEMFAASNMLDDTIPMTPLEDTTVMEEGPATEEG